MRPYILLYLCYVLCVENAIAFPYWNGDEGPCCYFLEHRSVVKRVESCHCIESVGCVVRMSILLGTLRLLPHCGYLATDIAKGSTGILGLHFGLVVLNKHGVRTDLACFVVRLYAMRSLVASRFTNLHDFFYRLFLLYAMRSLVASRFTNLHDVGFSVHGDVFVFFDAVRTLILTNLSGF